MKELFKSIGWDEIYPETEKRIMAFKEAVRTQYDVNAISDEELDKCLVYTFGRFGQGMVYNIYQTAINSLEETGNITLGEAFKIFIEAFKNGLGEELFQTIKPIHFVDFFVEYIYSVFIKSKG